MQAYIRRIHNVSQRPEFDTVGPFTIRESDDIMKLWRTLRPYAGSSLSRRHKPRFQDGGAVFFLASTYHCMMVMPVGSDLHKRHAPPSHYAPGGPLEGED